jgi:NAD(P)-dependent dehydrogenase (short-subunit alcohol dehydrogenase family)
MPLAEDRVALVTGGGNGIGREVALALAAEGAAVVVNDLGGDWHGEGRDESAASLVVEEIEAAGGRAVADHGSVSDSEGAAAMVAQAIDVFGGLDIVVNAAGILRDRTLTSMSDEEWDAVVAVHLRGHFCVTRAAARHWRARTKQTGTPVDGRVICFSSEAGIYGNPGQINYAAAKGGIVALAQVAALELGRYGVTCNTIAPRARTRMTEGTFGQLLPRSEDFDDWSPANVAPMVVFLCSEAGGRYSGQLFVAGGGVVQVLDHIAVAQELSTAGRAPTPEAIGAFVAHVRGESAAPRGFPLAEALAAALREGSAA